MLLLHAVQLSRILDSTTTKIACSAAAEHAFFVRAAHTICYTLTVVIFYYTRPMVTIGRQSNGSISALQLMTICSERMAAGKKGIFFSGFFFLSHRLAPPPHGKRYAQRIARERSELTTVVCRM